jgi:hypothetical protein
MKGTNIRRKDITRKNYEDAISQLYKLKDPTAIMTTSVWKRIPKSIADRIFKFKVGQRVFLSLNSNHLVIFFNLLFKYIY